MPFHPKALWTSQNSSTGRKNEITNRGEFLVSCTKQNQKRFHDTKVSYEDLSKQRHNVRRLRPKSVVSFCYFEIKHVLQEQARKSGPHQHNHKQTTIKTILEQKPPPHPLPTPSIPYQPRVQVQRMRLYKPDPTPPHLWRSINQCKFNKSHYSNTPPYPSSAQKKCMKHSPQIPTPACKDESITSNIDWRPATGWTGMANSRLVPMLWGVWHPPGGPHKTGSSTPGSSHWVMNLWMKQVVAHLWLFDHNHPIDWTYCKTVDISRFFSFFSGPLSVVVFFPGFSHHG